jgi:hypothetical protein
MMTTPRANNGPIITTADDDDITETEKYYPTITESDDDTPNESDIFHLEEKSQPSLSLHTTTAPNQSDALTFYDQNAKPSAPPASVKQQLKDSDDSKSAYGDRFASAFGNPKFAPEALSAQAMADKEWAEYDAWLNAPTFADRKRFPNHDRWNGVLNTNQTSFVLDPSIAFQDSVSQQFRYPVLQDEKTHPLLKGHGLPPDYQDLPNFVPIEFEAQTKPSSSASAASAYHHIDQVQAMMDFADEFHKTSHMKSKFVGQRIANNHFFVVSDHGGKKSGRKLQIWGGGAKESLNFASIASKQSLGKVEESDETYSTTTEYAHVPGRFTIARINPSETGFVLNRSENRIEKMGIGRFVITEHDYAYIGKTTLTLEEKAVHALAVKPHPKADPFIIQLAAKLQVVLVSAGKVAFVKNNINTHLLPERPEPYVLDTRRGEKFINFDLTNQQVISATYGSYTCYNQLQPGQLVLFQHQGKTILWEHDEKHPALNTIHLPSNQFLTDGKIHSTNENKIDWQNVSVINTIPGQVIAIQDEIRKIRFVESTLAETFILRAPWKFLGFTNKNENSFRMGSTVNGNETVRIMLRSSEWVAVLSQGRLSFYPPRLDGKPYYFSQPEDTVVGIVDKNKPGETKLQVPGIGAVSVVNIATGEIGACKLNNVYCFLNPSTKPYVFTPPDAFIELIDAKKPHSTYGDLHRIVLAPDQHAVIIKDGELRLLPDNGAELRGENGVYTFRANQFSIEGGGPKKKSDRNCVLGPIQSIIVGVGEKGYGTQNNKLKIWDEGQHYVYNNKNEWFTGFFTTNVDPVDIKDLPVTFKHGITGKINVFVSYHIDNPEKAIQQFKNHEILHEFIQTTTSSEMLKLCASRPPLGYSDLDFSTNQNKSVEPSNTNASETVKEMQASFMIYAKTLLEKYGVSISDMYIHTWTLANDFVQQVQENAKRLQNAHAEVAQAQITLQKAQFENKQAQQARENDIALQELNNKKLALELEAKRLQQENEANINAAKKAADAKASAAAKTAEAQAEADIRTLNLKQETDAQVTKAQSQLKQNEVDNEKVRQQKEAEIKQAELDNKRLALTLEANRLKQQNEAEVNASKKAMEAKAEADIKIANAKAEADVKIANAKAQVETAEQNALAATAEERARTRAQKEMAENRLAAKKAETDALLLETNAKNSAGEMEAHIAGEKEKARFAGLVPEQRAQLFLAEMQMKNMTMLLELLSKSNLQMPGVFTIDKDVLRMFQAPASLQPSQVTPFNLFVPAPMATNARTALLTDEKTEEKTNADTKGLNRNP